MHPLPKTIASIACLLMCAEASAGTGVFSRNFAQANRNVRGEEGRAFDAKVASALGQVPLYSQRVNECIKNSPSRSSAIGYFHFISDSTYRVVLTPTSPFTACLSKVLENQTLPAPPRAPYLIPITFTLQR